MYGIVLELYKNNIMLHGLLWDAFFHSTLCLQERERRMWTWGGGGEVGRTGLHLDLKGSSRVIAWKFLNSVESRLPHPYKWGSCSPYKVMQRVW